MKRSFFQAVFLYRYCCIDALTWTLTKCMEKNLGGNYTRMLRAILNKSWRQHPPQSSSWTATYHPSSITKTVQFRRTKHARHCWRSKDGLINDIHQWTPSHGRAKLGRPARTYIQQLCADTGCSHEDLPESIEDGEGWKKGVREIRADGMTWW